MRKEEIKQDRDTIRAAKANGFRAKLLAGYNAGWIEFHYRGKLQFYRGGSIGHNPSIVRYLAAEFIRETDAAEREKEA